MTDENNVQDGVTTTAGTARREIIEMADFVAREKNIDQEIIFLAMEAAIEKAGKAKYGQENDIRAQIDRKTGEIKLARYRHVVETIVEIVEVPEGEEVTPAAPTVDAVAQTEGTEGAEAPEDAVDFIPPSYQILLADAQEIDKKFGLDDYVIDELPPVAFDRVLAQNARQVIIGRVRDAERDCQFEEFKDKIGEVINGIVKRVEYGNVIVDIGRGEAILRRDETIPREHVGQGDRIRSYIYDVRREERGPQVFLSRSHPAFMAKLFMQEVPEIYDGIIEVKAVARDPGSRAKIAVFTNDPSIDPVGACVGMRGSRVQAIVNELQGEKIDIVPWSEDIATFIVNALSPAEIQKVVLDEEAEKVDVIVPEDQLSLAIGRRGQNVRLAATLTGCDIDVITADEESERNADQIAKASEAFTKVLDVDDVLSRILIMEGFMRIEEVAYVDVEEIAAIEGLDGDIAAELQNRARDYIEAEQAEFEKKRQEYGVSDAIAGLEGMTAGIMAKLGENKIKERDDLADLAGDELIELLGADVPLSEAEANAIIMAARAHWFAEDAAEAS
ncbi:MAG: transcription termination factor NusA [Alphaproteobacteria bacterium]